MALIDMLRENFKSSPETAELQAAFEMQTDKMQDAKDDLLLQLNVDSATWGLGLWEKAFGIETDVSKPYTLRRSHIKSKMRSQGVTTVSVIKNVAQSYSSGDVEVLEYPSEYRFLIKFKGSPPNFDDLTDTIEDIKPAHLAWNFIFIMQGDISFGSANISGESGRVLPDVPNNIKANGLLTAGSAEKSGESAVVYPQVEDTITTKGPLFMACFLKIGEHAKITS